MAHATYLCVFVWVNYSNARRDPIEIMLRIGGNYPEIAASFRSVNLSWFIQNLKTIAPMISVLSHKYYLLLVSLGITIDLKSKDIYSMDIWYMNGRCYIPIQPIPMDTNTSWEGATHLINHAPVMLPQKVFLHWCSSQIPIKFNISLYKHN